MVRAEMQAFRCGMRYFFFGGAAFLSVFAGAFALAFFLSLPCALLPFAMFKSFSQELSQAPPPADSNVCSFAESLHKTSTFTGTFLLASRKDRMNSSQW